ncbi:MAG: DUF4271 domain-containing protein [Bacteroidota bacterium]
MPLFRSFLPRTFICTILLLLCNTVYAKVQLAQYTITTISDSAVKVATKHSMDTVLATHPQLANQSIINAIEHPHLMNDKTADFYLLLFLCLMLGLIRLSDFRYFQSLWRAFWNPSLSSRQLKDQMESSSLSNLLMNIFFTMSGGAYIFYVVGLLVPQRHGSIPPSLLIIMLVLGMMLIYLTKFAMIKFSGWAFKVEGITESYLFNMFLINKIIGIVLLPFIILFAFADAAYTGPIIIVSFIAIGILVVNRYTRSWKVFGSFFQYSKFHFFTYLCASELLPLAVLMKLFVQGLLYY